MNKVYFISFYTDNMDYKHYVLSMINKINYVLDSLVNNHYPVHMISVAEGNRNYRLKFLKKSKRTKENGVLIEEAPTIVSSIKLVRGLSRLMQKIWLVFKLLILPKNSVIIVYHSLSLIRIIKVIRKLKSFKVILECEEIYNDIHPNVFINKKIEQDYVREMDAYIFSTELLNDKYNTSCKPYAILYGTYKKNEIKTKKHCDKKIHLVYSGTFDREKGGAQNAVYASDYLDDNFVLHIIGFGSLQECEDIKKMINERKNSSCKIIYDGLKTGEEYTNYLQKCHIGLSTQNSSGIYNDSSFPSKVLTYFSNELDVISVKIDVLQRSEIKQFINFCDDSTPQNIAQSIMNFKHFDTKGEMEQLNINFQYKIMELINQVGRMQ